MTEHTCSGVGREMVQEGQHVQILWYVAALAEASRGDPIHMIIVLVISEGL
jgi:hypothetical protein